MKFEHFTVVLTKATTAIQHQLDRIIINILKEQTTSIINAIIFSTTAILRMIILHQQCSLPSLFGLYFVIGITAQWNIYIHRIRVTRISATLPSPTVVPIRDRRTWQKDEWTTMTTPLL